MTAFYNEIAAYPAAWTRNLIAAGHVADGVVDERSIVELDATELVGFEQCHFFAGISGWSYALRLAGWPDDRPVWTASCPCQPFSTAGKGRGVDDERHLWPVLFELVRECRPAILFGEQVASPAGRSWFDVVSADLESAGYAVGAANLCAAGVGAPHIRQRLYFVAVADADGAGPQGRGERWDGGDERATRASGVAGAMADADGHRSIGRRRADRKAEGVLAEPSHGGRDDVRLADNSSGGRSEGRVSRYAASERAGSPDDGRMGDADRDGTGRNAGSRDRAEAAGDRARLVDGRDGHDAGASGPWSDAEWIPCTDGKSRPVIPRLCLLVDGIPATMGHRGANQDAKEAQEVADAKDSKAGSSEDVPPVRGGAITKEVQWGVGGHGRVHAPKVLRPWMHGGVNGGCDQAGEPEEQPSSISEVGEGGVRDVRTSWASPPCPPHRRESSEQRTCEFADFVRLLPQAIALAQLERDDRTASGLRTLLEARTPAGVVLHSPESVQAVWRSIDEEGQARIYLEARARGLVVAPVSPLEPGTAARVGRLAGYGNAIVPTVAATWIRAVMEVRP